MQNCQVDRGVYLTYAAADSGDGLGAQAQRLMGIYSAARELGMGYVHTPIKSIEVNPGDPHGSRADRLDYLLRVNSTFLLPSDTTTRPRSILRLASLSRRNVTSLQVIHRVARACGKAILVELPSSLPWSDWHPDSYERAAKIIRSRIPFREEENLFRVDVHIRRAVAPKLSRDGSPYDRYVPNAWYAAVLNEISQYLNSMTIPFIIRIHTDLPKERWKVPVDTTAGTLGMWKHHRLLDDEGFLVSQSEDLYSEFHEYGFVEIARDWDPLDALSSMTTANLLVLCASSFSYVAALLRTGAGSISPKFFHNPQTRWRLVPEIPAPGDLEALRTYLDAHLTRT